MRAAALLRGKSCSYVSWCWSRKLEQGTATAQGYGRRAGRCWPGCEAKHWPQQDAELRHRRKRCLSRRARACPVQLYWSWWLVRA